MAEGGVSSGLHRRASPFACAGAEGWAKLRLMLAKSASAMAIGITTPIWPKGNATAVDSRPCTARNHCILMFTFPVCL